MIFFEVLKQHLIKLYLLNNFTALKKDNNPNKILKSLSILEIYSGRFIHT